MSRPIAALLCAVAASLAAASAVADDSTAGLTSGGIELRKSDGIEMSREDLYLSMRAVHASFRFRNVTGRDVETIVAFPVPDVDGRQMVMGDVDVPMKDPVNFMGFKTWVDGKPIKANIEQKALAGGADRTAVLRRLGLPLNPAAAKPDELPQAAKDELLRLGLVQENYATPARLQPTWKLKTTYWWRQVFPAARELRIEHRYTPSLSDANADLGDLLDDQGRFRGVDLRELQKMAQDDCIDLADLKALAVKAHKSDGPAYSWNGLDYVLTSGANWRGPIRDFRLVVEKPDPQALMGLRLVVASEDPHDVTGFCAPGLRKISPTQVAWRKRDFVPDHDLSVLFLSRDAVGR